MGKVIKMNILKPAKSKKTGNPNVDLKNDLLSKGYYVQSVGRGGEFDIDYLIVSTAPPKNIEVIPSSSN